MSAISDAVDLVLASVVFREPVSHEDCRQVRDAMRAIVPEAKIEVYYVPGEVRVLAEFGETVKRTAKILPST